MNTGGDYTINLIDETGRSDVFNWYLDEIAWGSRFEDEKAAHEFGHLLGLFDEYSGASNPFAESGDLCSFTNFPITGGTLPFKTGNWCGSLMSDLGSTQERYYERLFELSGLDQSLNPVFGMAPEGYYAFDVLTGTVDDGIIEVSDPSIASVPVPASGFLLLGSIGLLIGRRRSAIMNK